jgi:hypothetical protein
LKKKTYKIIVGMVENKVREKQTNKQVVYHLLKAFFFTPCYSFRFHTLLPTAAAASTHAIQTIYFFLLCSLVLSLYSTITK